MRISDWSSDVCSSDLLIFHELAHQRFYVKDDTEFNESFATFVEQEEIGRASCRERACQYVYISVVPVPLTTQKNHIPSLLTISPPHILIIYISPLCLYTSLLYPSYFSFPITTP